MSKRKPKRLFNVFTGNSLSPYRLMATSVGNAMHKFRKETGATNFGADDRGGFKGYTVKLA